MEVSFTIAAQVDNFDEIAALAVTIWTEHYEPLVGRAQVVYMLEKFQSARAIAEQITEQNYVYTMLWADRELAGYAGVKPEADGSLLLSKIYILKKFRGRGLGRRLFEHATRPFVRNGGTRVWLTVNKKNAGSIAVYQKLGLAVEREQTADIGGGYVMDDYVMALTIFP